MPETFAHTVPGEAHASHASPPSRSGLTRDAMLTLLDKLRVIEATGVLGVDLSCRKSPGSSVSAHPVANGIYLSLLEHVSPIEWDNVVLYGQYILDRKLVRHRRRTKRVGLSV